LIQDPNEKEEFLRSEREKSAIQSRKRYQRSKSLTGFGSKQDKKYHEAAKAIKAGTATEEDKRLVENKKKDLD